MIWCKFDAQLAHWSHQSSKPGAMGRSLCMFVHFSFVENKRSGSQWLSSSFQSYVSTLLPFSGHHRCTELCLETSAIRTLQSSWASIRPSTHNSNLGHSAKLSISPRHILGQNSISVRFLSFYPMDKIQPESSSRNGSWLVEEGPYQRRVKRLSRSDPGLRQPDEKLKKFEIPWEDRAVRIWTVESIDGTVQRRSIPDPQGLADDLQLSVPERISRRSIYMFEGMNRKVATILGNNFNMHPSVFLDYLRVWHFTPVSVGSTKLASSLVMQRHVCMAYPELVALPETVKGNFKIKCEDTGRHVGVTRTKGKFDNVGMIRRKCVIWNCKAIGRDEWTSMLDSYLGISWKKISLALTCRMQVLWYVIPLYEG